MPPTREGFGSRLLKSALGGQIDGTVELRFEPDGKPDGAALSVTLWNGESADGETLPLGRGDYHGRWIDWAPGG